FLKQSTSIDKKEVIEGEEVSLKIDYDAMGRRWEGRNLTVNLEDYSGNQLAYVSNSCMLDGKRMSASSIHIDRKTVKIDLPSMNENTHSQLSLKLKVQKSDTTSTNGKIKCITSVKDESPQVSINPLIISGIPDRITQEVFVDKDNIIQGDTINCTIKQLVHFQESTNRNLEISVKDFLDAGVILKYVPDSLYINDVKITPQSISKDKITVHLSDIKYSNKDTNVTIRLQFKVFQSSTKDVKQQIKFHFNDSEYNRRDDFISMKIRGIYKGDIEAIGNVYNLYLGDTLKEDRPINCIVNKVIKVGENVVDPMDYKLNWEKPLRNISTETIGEKSASIKITYLPTHKEKTIQVPINVHYGNSLLIMDTDKRALGTFRLSDNNIIESHQGGEINDNEVLEKGNNDKIYEVDWYDFANKHNGYDENIDDVSHGEFLVEGLGNDHKLDVLKKWSKCKVSEGDILRVTEKSPEKVFYTKDNQKITINSKRKNVFFEIFNHQYRLLNINNLCSKIPTIKIGTSHQEIDQKINTYTNNQFDNVSIEKIIEYPDTASPGMKKAKIQVSEILSTQKRYWLKTYHQKVHYVMDMEFYVTDGGEIRLSVPDKIEFENLDTIYSKEQIINRKKDKNLGIRVTDTRTKKSSWSIDLQVVKGDLLPYTVWKDENDNYKYLNNPVKIYESSGLDEQEIDISSNWRRNAQLLFRIPKKTYLPTGSYSEILVWNLIQGPN
ncbi:hypothetical protein Q3C83_13245, partial [Enterococcus faecium]|nr:hypothetical protein [Enterococcus faecium]